MRKLLIVDDDPAFREFVAAVAAELSYECHWVDDGRDVEQACRDHVPDVIIVDMVLPGLDGIEVLRKMADNPVDARLVLVSGHSMIYLNAARAIASASGIEDVAVAEKPFSLSELRDILA